MYQRVENQQAIPPPIRAAAPKNLISEKCTSPMASLWRSISLTTQPWIYLFEVGTCHSGFHVSDSYLARKSKANCHWLTDSGKNAPKHVSRAMATIFFCCSLAKTKNYLYNTYVYLKVGPSQRHVRLRFGIVN